MAKEFIVAIELGSSKMRGIAGQKNLDGSINVLAVAEEDSTKCIRKGVVYKADQAGQCLASIMKKLKNALKQEITHVYVGVGGQSIRSVRNMIAKDLPEGTFVSQEIINEMMDENRSMVYADQEILDAVTQEYKVDSRDEVDPVSVQCSRLEGNFLNILWRKNFYRNLNKCFDDAGVAIAEMYLAPLALADSVLTDVEKRSGCVLVDLGADTSTVSVYYKGLLRNLAVIPLGGSNITRDIASLQMEEANAEEMKLKYARAYTDNADIDNTLSYPIDGERSVESRKFIEIVEDRLDEIIENVWCQVPVEYVDKLLGGVILTGGGSNMPGIERAFRNHTNVEKIRVAKFVTQTINSHDPRITSKNGTMNTLLGLLAKGDMNCAGDEIRSDFFGGATGGTAQTLDSSKVRPAEGTSKQGVVRPVAEKKKAEEEAKAKADAEAKAKAEAEAKAKAEADEERRKNNVWHKLGRGIRKFGKQMLQADDE